MKEFDEFFKMENSQSLGDMYQSKGFIKGKDVEVDIKLDFKEAYEGTTRIVEYPCNILCNPCNSTGVKPGEKIIECP